MRTTGRLMETYQAGIILGSNNEPGNTIDDVVLNFKADKKFQVSKNGQTVASGNFHVYEHDRNRWMLIPREQSDYLFGHVLLCENELVFSSHEVDGPNYYFKRIP